MSNRISKQQGAALIFSLLVSLLLGVFAGFFTYKAQQNIKLAEQLSAQLLARSEAENQLKKAIYAISSLGFSGVEWPDSGKKYPARYWGENENVASGVNVSYQDLASKLSIIPFRPEEWKGVLQYHGLENIVAQGIVDKIEDWMDNDSFRRVQGMEKRGYQYENSDIYPRNALMQSIDELAFIPGVNTELLDKIRDEVVYWGTSARTPLLGSNAMILSYGDDDILRSVTEQRKIDGNLRSVYNSLQGADVSSVSDVSSGFFRIIVEIETEKSHFTRVADVNLRGTDIMPFYVIGWQ